VDEKKFLNLLKNLQSIMKCPSCGSVYEVSEMQFVGSQDGYFLLSLTCHDCNLTSLGKFFRRK
jgi:transposase-like protein